MSTSITIATALINWNELWKIILAAVVGGTGVVIVFGLMLLGISRGKTAARPVTRYGLYTLSGVCGFVVIAVAAVGIYGDDTETLVRETQGQSGRRPRSNWLHARTGRSHCMNRGSDHRYSGGRRQARSASRMEPSP